jgi:hypothetical protein
MWGAVAVCVIMIALDLVLLNLWHLNVYSSEFHPQLMEFNQAIKSAYEAKISDSHTIFEYGIVLLAALWGVVLFQTHGGVIAKTDYPEITMFACSNALFGMFTAIHYCYTEMLISGLLYAGKPDQEHQFIYHLDIWEIRRLFWLQLWTLAAFIVIGCAALFSVNRLK